MKFNKKIEVLSQVDFLRLFTEFVIEIGKGLRMRSTGKMINKATVINYLSIAKFLNDFFNEGRFELKLYLVNNLTKDKTNNAWRYSQQFYVVMSGYIH